MRPVDEDSFYGLFNIIRHLHFHRSIERLEKLGLNFGQPPVLYALWRLDGQTQADIARELHRTPATITATMQRMEQAGWIVRKPDPNDQRAIRVYLTQKSRDIRLQVEATLDDLDEQTFKGFSDVEQVLLRRFFVQIKENLIAIRPIDG